MLWHDLEHSGYTADLEHWARVATRFPSARIAELGCGTGRVARQVALRTGAEVVGIDRDPFLLAAMRSRIAPGLAVHGMQGELPTGPRLNRVDAVIAPALFLQLMDDPEQVHQVFEWAKASLARGGVLAATISEELVPVPNELASSLPADAARIGGRLFESRIASIDESADRRLVIRRVRRIDGDDIGEVSEVLLQVRPTELEGLAREAGFRLGSVERIRSSGRHAGVSLFIFHVK